jgi:nitrate/nitrite transporter NarK
LYRPTSDPRHDTAGTIGAVSEWRAVGANVWWLGLTSLVTDVSSEMVTSILPAYTVLVLGLSPATFGLLDGVHQSGASLARIVSGLATDRLGRYREIAAAGYIASALGRLVLLLSGASPVGLAAAIATGRVGKGVRTSPRDALISMSAPASLVGTAFGLHRTLDTIGATLGLIAAFSILRFTRDDYGSVMVASLAIALIGVAILLTYVRNPRPEHVRRPPALRLREAIQLALVVALVVMGPRLVRMGRTVTHS